MGEGAVFAVWPCRLALTLPSLEEGGSSFLMARLPLVWKPGAFTLPWSQGEPPRLRAGDGPAPYSRLPQRARRGPALQGVALEARVQPLPACGRGTALNLTLNSRGQLLYAQHRAALRSSALPTEPSPWLRLWRKAGLAYDSIKDRFPI